MYFCTVCKCNHRVSVTSLVICKLSSAHWLQASKLSTLPSARYPSYRGTQKSGFFNVTLGLKSLYDASSYIVHILRYVWL